jgi:hypothetical protein
MRKATVTDMKTRANTDVDTPAVVSDGPMAEEAMVGDLAPATREESKENVTTVERLDTWRLIVD